MSSSSGPPGTSVTANGSGFQNGETVDVSFNGQSVGTPTVNSGGSFSLSFTVPTNSAPGQYGVLAAGRNSGKTASSSFSVNQSGGALSFEPPQAIAGAAVIVTGTGFRAGESVTLAFNGATVDNETADTNGVVIWNFRVPPSVSPGQFDVTATGTTSDLVVSTTYVIVGPTPGATAVPTAAPTPRPVPTVITIAVPPAMIHDERYFSQTGYRIDSDDIWSFFQQYGGIETFGYPTSRMITFLGCPVQMFQRQILQVCGGGNTALLNMLDPEIFPYTQVNGSTFPPSDETMKANTPPVSSPTYATDMAVFVEQNVTDTFGGQPVNFQQQFTTTGGLTIWGAPISQPAPDPANGGFIYQRFQRGIMHYIAGTGTESILLADYLKAILTGENIPPDLNAQSKETNFYQQYCPGQPQWLCRPQELSGTDLTFAFVQG